MNHPKPSPLRSTFSVRRSTFDVRRSTFDVSNSPNESNVERRTPNVERRTKDYRESNLADSIERAITARDLLWANLANTAIITRPALNRLALANQALLELLQLTAGPTTPVLPPARAMSELRRARICTTFIGQVALEVIARKQAARCYHLTAQSGTFLQTFISASV